MNVKVRCIVFLKIGKGVVDGFDVVVVRDLVFLDVVLFKFVFLRRRIVGNIEFLKEDKVLFLWDDDLIVNGVLIEGIG